ncbi:MAG: DUF3416 domain-containing protein [Magnetospirillum sp.]|nr:DUF3416 domain-containing protein [Magnetospirillum sp.]
MPTVSSAPRLYNLFPLLAGPVAHWPAHLERIAAMGFDWVYVNPVHYPGFSGSLYAIKDPGRLHPLLAGNDPRPGDEVLSAFAAAARGHGLKVMLDLVINHTARDALLVDEHPDWFARRPDGDLLSPSVADPADPTVITEWGDLAEIDYGPPDRHPDLAAHWAGVVRRYIRLGFSGFRCDAATKVPAAVWRPLIAAARQDAADVHFAAETLGCTPEQIEALAAAGFDTLFNSAKWWDFHAPWLLEQYDQLRAIAPSIAFPESHDTARLAEEVAGHGETEDWYRLRALFSAFFSAGWMIPIGYEYGFSRRLHVVDSRPDDWEAPRFDLSPFIAGLNRVKAETPALGAEGPQRRLTDPASALVVLLRQEKGGDGAAVLSMNTDPWRAHALDTARLLADCGLVAERFEDVTPEVGHREPPGHHILAPLEARLYRSRLAAARLPPPLRAGALPEVRSPGIVISDLQPRLEFGRWPVKREIGDVLEVSADILKDGHEVLAARVLWRQRGDLSWHEAAMAVQDNDRWVGRVPLTRIGRCRFTVEAWVDAYRSWAADLAKKREAGQGVGVDLAEGRLLLAEAATRVEGDDRGRLDRLLMALDGSSAEEQAGLMTSALVHAIMDRWPDRRRAVRFPTAAEVVVDRVAARFAAWYEMMPRSQGTLPGRSATFADCERRLPEIARMGFDVLYLLPIHPIGRVHRKGADNALVAGPDDPGSPYAIGAAEGGHTAIHPDLGTIDDFRRFAAAVHRHGMELALDFAIQCAPDHPWVEQHPEWFVWRPDGTLKYAENPPKKYQDIVNVDFHGSGAAALWQELLDVVLFWVGEGVRIFRVDNPHTKPLPFWEWLIATVQDAHPDVLFLAEAFTRPKMMRALAKAGFSQSYTYFTWRNFKPELEAYIAELAEGEAREYMRPHFWPSTPDILPPFLQRGGRAAFRIRLVLAATLSSLYGIYNGYELCEGTGIPGREEYLHSEKYQHKVWDWSRAGHIKDEITALNRIRRDNPALHEFENVRFHPAADESVLFYGKATLDRTNVLFIAVTLDPFDVREAVLTFPLAEMGVPPGETFEVEDLLTGQRHLWRGAEHGIRLDPAINPAAIFRVTVWASVDYRTPCL